MSSPPRSSRATSSVTSTACTQRTGTSNRSAPASTTGSPRRTTSNDKISRSVINTGPTLQHVKPRPEISDRSHLCPTLNRGQTRSMSDLIARHRAVIPNWVGVYYNEPIEIVSGKGCRVTDGEGRSYLDFFAGILTNMLGYDVPEVRDAVERQIASGVVHSSTLYLIRNQIELAEKIVRLSGMPNAKVFFTNSGTEANETALLACLTARKADQVLAMRGSYHGRSFGAVSVTGVAAWKMSSHDPFGTHYLHGTDRQLPQYRNLSDADYIKACVDDLRALLTAGVHPADVGCLLAEPVQGVGGFTMAPDGLLAAYKEVLDEHGILLISDEVQTGWGRT